MEPTSYILLMALYLRYGIWSHLFSCENFQPKCMLHSVSNSSVLTLTIAVVVMEDGGDCGGGSSNSMAEQPAGSITPPMVITLNIMTNNNKNVVAFAMNSDVKSYRWLGGKIPAIIALITTWSRGVVHFMLRPLYTMARQPVVNIRFNGAQNKIRCPLTGTEPQYTRPQPITSCKQ